VKFAFIAATKDKTYPVSFMCRRLGVSCSGFYAWRKRLCSAHDQRDQALGEKVEATFTELRGVCGAPRIHDALRKAGESTSKKRVARLMQERGLSAKAAKSFVRTTDSAHNLAVSENLLGRDFNAAAANRAWVSDITYVRTWEGWLYLAVVIDLFSRRVIGFAMDDHMRAELAVDALRMAARERRPGQGLIHHSDRGAQYASADYRRELSCFGMRASMSRNGDCWDNAVAESFFATIKRELIDRQPWPTRRRAKAAIAEYIACFYNTKRAHSTLGFNTPVDFELEQRRQTMAA
jgi:putative transposase